MTDSTSSAAPRAASSTVLLDEDLRQDDGMSETAASWTQSYQRPWEKIAEDAFGKLVIDEKKNERKQIDAINEKIHGERLQKGMIRYVYLIVDESAAMAQTDLKPNRLVCAIRAAVRFVKQFFDANPLSQMGLVSSREVSRKVEDVCSAPLALMSGLRSLEFASHSVFSLQNALHCALTSLSQIPAHGSKEVILLCAALNTVDAGDIFSTIAALKRERVRVSAIWLSAEVRIVKYVTQQTGGDFYVPLNEEHLRECFERQVPPQVLDAAHYLEMAATRKWVPMGFPEHRRDVYPSLCACHSKFTYAGFYCPQCKCKVCDLPYECPVCALSLISSPHLVRSYHHLFPVARFTDVESTVDTAVAEVKTDERMDDESLVATDTADGDSETRKKGAVLDCFGCGATVDSGEHLVQRCPKCSHTFCFDCNEFTHLTLHNCVGCLSQT